MNQLELWEEVPTHRAKPPARISQGSRRIQAPKRECRECGRPIGRRWHDAHLCKRCSERAFPRMPAELRCCKRCPEGQCSVIPF